MERIRAHIARVKSQSEEEKFAYAFKVSTALTGVIICIWVVYFFYSIDVQKNDVRPSSDAISNSFFSSPQVQDVKKMFTGFSEEIQSKTNASNIQMKEEQVVLGAHESVKELESLPQKNTETSEVMNAQSQQ
jgi:hypothetical protein